MLAALLITFGTFLVTWLLMLPQQRIEVAFWAVAASAISVYMLWLIGKIGRSSLEREEGDNRG